MDKSHIEPPSFLSEDTSREHAKKIPLLILGPPKLVSNDQPKLYRASLRTRFLDVSGNCLQLFFR